jgi:hypothetical protein
VAQIQVDPDATQTHNQILSALYERLLLDNPAIGWIPQGGTVKVTDGMLFQWPDEERSEQTLTLTVNYTAGDGDLDVSSSANARVGDIVYIDQHYDANDLQVKFRVTAIPDATHLTVSVIAGADTNHLIATSTTIHRTFGIYDNFAPEDDSAYVYGDVTEPTLRSNYVQTFERPWNLGLNLQLIAEHGSLEGLEPGQAPWSSLAAKALEEAMYKLAFDEYNAIVHGVPVAATSSLGAMMGGFMHFINTSSDVNRVNAGGNAMTEDDINDALALSAGRGLPQNEELVAIMSIPNARVLSSIKNDIIQYPKNEAGGTLGGSVQQYISEIPGYPGLSLVVDRNFPDYFVPIIARNRVKLVSPAGRPVMEAVPGTKIAQHGTTEILRAQRSLIVVGATHYHSVIRNISP